ncbi:hypothetical protein ABBQ32_012289 [Trebouxia sp. C0010 RCD-2024]
MSSAELIDLTDDVPSNKRQRLTPGPSEYEASSSSAPTLTSSRWGPNSDKATKHQSATKPNKPFRSPELDANLFELGTVRLPCEVAKGSSADTTIHSLKQRLAPYGFEKRNDGVKADYDGQICLDNLFERQWKGCVGMASQYESTYIELDPCIHEPLPPLPAQQRVEAVTVCYTDGSAAPVTYGIPIEWDGMNQQLSDGVMRQCGLSEDKQVVLVMLENNLFDRFLQPEHPVHKFGHACYANWGRFAEPDEYGNADTETNDSEASDSDSSSEDGHMHPYTCESVVLRCKKLHHTVAYIVPARKPSADTVIYNIVYTNSSALPLLVPMKSSISRGGKEADKQVRAAIKTALTPAARATPNRNKPYALSHCNRYGSNSGQPYTQTLYDWTVDQHSYLCAVWSRAELNMEYNMKIMAEPAVHESAAKEVLEESSKGMVQLRQYDLAKGEARDRPWQLISDLHSASATCMWPSIRVELNLEPDSKRPDETRGTVVLKVWCWRNGTSRVAAQQLMLQLDDWWALKDLSYESQAQNFRLKHFMNMLLWGHPHHDHLQAELAQWDKLDSQKLRTLTGMLQLLQADTRPEADQPEGLTVQLRPYQRQSLQFMIDNENTEGGFRHHLFCSVTNSKGERYWYSPILGRICQDVAAMPQGGILGEEMGLGKTVEIAALMLSRPAPELQPAHQTTSDGLLVSRATLVVCPVTLMGQWYEELADKTGGTLKVVMHHGTKRSRDPKDLTGYDVVLVTYQTLGLEFSRGLKEVSGTEGGVNLFPPCGSILWHRIVLDEAHTVKNPTALMSKACTALRGDKRWCVTGTPVGTDIADLKGQFNFLQLHPFTNKNFFNTYVKPAYSGSSWARSPAYVLLYVLGQCMIRHTKLQVLEGEEILQLPKKTEELVPVAFSSVEQELYMHVFERARTKYQMFRSQGPHMVSKRLIQIMSTLLPLRRICSGGQLSDKDLAVEMPESVGKVSMAVDASAVCTEEACCICFESPLREPTMTKCNHWFCWECIGTLLQASRVGNAPHLVCPLCRAKVQGQELVKGVNEGAQALEEEDSLTATLEQQAGSSESKLNALLEELRVMREREPSAKALVFSQFASTIDWLKVKLQEQGFGYRTISGSMTLKQRSKAIEAFQKDPPTTVFLLSMRSGSVGINLTSANHVFILEPALNPALEEQAVGRAWRMGQQREVTVKKFYVKVSFCAAVAAWS